jgi:hypothetical protein
MLQKFIAFSISFVRSFLCFIIFFPQRVWWARGFNPGGLVFLISIRTHAHIPSWIYFYLSLHNPQQQKKQNNHNSSKKSFVNIVFLLSPHTRKIVIHLFFPSPMFVCFPDHMLMLSFSCLFSTHPHSSSLVI